VIIPALGIGPLGSSEWNVGGVSGLGAAATGGTQPATGAGSFGNALSNAVSSLETTQNNATEASQQLATGQLTDPTQAITAVENASLSMQFASQLRNQIDAAATTIFQTQV
jgi:flagellar hook-basal body complex protein FliE